ncbi:hypothetical protein Scep_022965 [Stephania cephalantha]|uniref:Uncharacterized protein n=1 Tax=Stephania cephalantha TaxID=152367 RepID=A0AAP0F7E8_9MAGN
MVQSLSIQPLSQGFDQHFLSHRFNRAKERVLLERREEEIEKFNEVGGALVIKLCKNIKLGRRRNIEEEEKEKPGRSEERVEKAGRRGVSPDIDSTGVDTGDQLATKDPVDLDSGIDYGVLECVVRSTPATERDQVDTGDQLAIKDSVDLDSRIDYGVLECVVRSTSATERDQVIASWVHPLVRSWKGIPKYGIV